MSQAEVITIPEVNFRTLEAADLDSVMELSQQFFDESELGDFSTYNPEGCRATFELTLTSPAFECLIFSDQGRVEGFITWFMESSYTKEPLALGHLLYVTPQYRRSPVGKILLETAENMARDYGCCAFYQGAMAGIDGVAKTLPNMLRKNGYDELFWGRKILKDTT